MPDGLECSNSLKRKTLIVCTVPTGWCGGFGGLLGHFSLLAISESKKRKGKLVESFWGGIGENLHLKKK